MKFKLDDINCICRKIFKYIEEYNFSGATILALHGNLGAGKTTFTQNFSKYLGVQDYVNSPTFVIQKRYNIDGDRYSNLIHIDAYRLSNSEEVKVLGLEEEMRNVGNLIVIEWPENIREVLLDDMVEIYLDHTGKEGVREIRVVHKGEDITTILEECRE